MKQKHMKKLGSFLLAGAMVLTMFPTFLTEVHAAENQLPTKEQFATVEELKTFNTNDNDGTISAAKVYFGNNNQKWWIAGSQGENELTLSAERPLVSAQMFSGFPIQDKPYSEEWKCTYTGNNPVDVFPNHYGASPLRTTLKGLESSFFTSKEQALMNDTTVYTNDTKNSSVYSTTDKLYLAYGYENDQYVTVGKNAPDSLNNGLRIDKNYWRYSGEFWIRAPHLHPNGVDALIRASGAAVYNRSVVDERGMCPAFELNLSSVIFASAAPAASDRNLTLQDTDGKGAFTLRYDATKSSKNLGSALVSYDKSKVTLTNVPENTYLVVQNSSGAWAKKITNEKEVSAGTMGVDSFANCKVWLETTDTANRMTYATLADEEQGYDVNITTGEGLAVTNGTQGVGQGSAITDITVEVANGYYLPEDYISNLQTLTWNGLTATQTDSGFKISGTPTSNVTVTLPAATKKVYSMTVTGSGTFTTVCKDYQPITATEFTITNNGNVDLTNINVSVTGTNADKFELSADSTTATIQPNGTTKVTVKPKDALAVGAYQATLSVSADNVAEQPIALQFTVNEHEYNTVVTPPTCTKKGYTTYTCKNCNHSYKDNEVAAKGHTFGDWEIITSPSCDQGGSRKHTCTVCAYVETENLNPAGHAWEDDYTVDKEPTCTEDGSKSIHCKNCDAVKDSTTIAKLGHSFTNYVSDGNATCTKDGTKTAKCDRCDATDTVADMGTMLEHEYEWVYNNDAACEKNGTETGTCKYCHTTVIREKADTALGHEFKNYVSDDNATCTENGTETAKCERCDKTDTRVQENSALGHDLGEWNVIKDATTTETGIKERHCARCDYKETETIPVISKPAQPNDNHSDKDNANSDTNKESPKTGDNSNMALWIALLFVSGIGVFGTTLYGKKKKSMR